MGQITGDRRILHQEWLEEPLNFLTESHCPSRTGTFCFHQALFALPINSIILVCFQVQFREKLNDERRGDFLQMPAGIAGHARQIPGSHFYFVREKKQVLIKFLCVNSFKTRNTIPIHSLCSCSKCVSSTMAVFKALFYYL